MFHEWINIKQPQFISLNYILHAILHFFSNDPLVNQKYQHILMGLEDLRESIHLKNAIRGLLLHRR